MPPKLDVACPRMLMGQFASVLLHLIELLLLIVSQKGANLPITVLGNTVNLSLPVLSRQGCVRMDALHLLLPIFKDAPDLFLLAMRKDERPTQPIYFLIWTHLMAAAPRQPLSAQPVSYRPRVRQRLLAQHPQHLPLGPELPQVL